MELKKQASEEVAYMAANTDQEIAPLNENNDQPKDSAIDIPEEDSEPGRECCIYKVPRCFRAGNEEAYTPHLISIGPMHHVFIITLFLRDFTKKQESTKEDYNDDEEDVYFDFLNQSALLRVKLLTDLMLLENQLPFFVLEDLYKLAFLTSSEPSFLNLVCLYFGVNKDPSFEKKKIKHFTDLIRYQVLRACSLNTSPTGSHFHVGSHNMHSATRLQEAGVEFKCAAVNDDFGVLFNGVSYNCYKIGGLEYEGVELIDMVMDDMLKCTTYGLLQVRLEKGVLKLFTIDVEYETEIHFRNLMAFEQYYYPKSAYFCSYIKLLDSLIDTSEDVNLLVKEGIIVNRLGSSVAVANMINNLAVGVVHSTLLYGEIGMELGWHYKNSWNRRWATLKHVYFNDPWRGTATIAAFIVVILTLIQTVLAILEKAMPKK
ncbi:hypothetical protein SCA6_015386 [Theobroma cacao]